MRQASEMTSVEQCQKGDLESFGVIYEKYFRIIYNYIFYKTGHKENAEDLTSIVFTRALKKINSYDPGRGNFSSWLYRIARNAIIDHYRAKKSEINIDEASGLKDFSDLSEETDLKLKIEKIEEGLSRLSPGQREIVLLRVWSGLSYAEIAEITEKSPAACKMAFSRAISELSSDPAFALALVYLAFKPLI